VLAGSSFPCAGFLFAFTVVAGWAALELSPCLLALLACLAAWFPLV